MFKKKQFDAFSNFFSRFWVFENQPTVHSGGVSSLAGGGSVAVAIGVSDMGQVYRWQVMRNT